MTSNSILPLVFAALAAVYCSTANALILWSCQDRTLVNRACVGQAEGAHVCWPCPVGKVPVGRSYLKCTKGNGTVVLCPKYTLYDYTKRACLSTKDTNITITLCPNFNCPLAEDLPFQGMANVTGTFGQPGNWTFTLPKKASSITVFSPVPGQCQMGMIMTITSRGPAPKTLRPPYQQQTINLTWASPMNNSMSGFATLPDFRGYTGDIVNIVWTEPNHLLATWDNQNRTLPPNRVPYPPQPVYKCPEFQPFANGLTQSALINETIIAPIDFSGNISYTLSKAGVVYFADPMPGSCRQGMVFKTTVLAAPINHNSTTTVVDWQVTTWDNFPDIAAYVGDELRFEWAQPNATVLSVPPHGVSMLTPSIVTSFITL